MKISRRKRARDHSSLNFRPKIRGIELAQANGMLELPLATSQSPLAYSPYSTANTESANRSALDEAISQPRSELFTGLRRRWQRERRRRKVGRAYDMALEIARLIPHADEILDVGCGNGFIAQHLAGLLGSYVLGIDVAGQPDAPINFRRYDGTHFPAADKSFEAVLFCYVLHHAQETTSILNELHRVLREDGVAIVYEDIPATGWDRLVCGIHNRQWRKRTGECRFRNEDEWRRTFQAAGFDIVQQRSLSRWRNLAHPVGRRLFLLTPTRNGASVN